ncbi:MAG: ribonuclease P protein component [Acidobacteria bacterium]|nr:MAG: ribonuclease P protein component [Acidobacteriota bacterium]PYX05670.1 MAG: ribonuclease P protein component [Acidobacteriota bacterium]PYX18196.1 MAG: ribonuclease P protein component [Acidobacteriota bacterium]
MSAIVPNGSSDLSGSGSRARFSRSSRLLRHADFERVYKQGQRHFAAHMTVFYLRRAQGDAARVGFTVGRVLGGAVDRNRMKRRLREAVRRHLPPGVPVDVVINPKKSLLTADFADLLDEVSRAFAVIQKATGNR